MQEEMTKIIRVADNNDYWESVLKNPKNKKLDIFCFPEYCNLFSNKNSEPFLFHFKKNEETWSLPLVKKRILIDIKKFPKIFDIETPYGYGGPFSTTRDPSFIKLASKAFMEWCLKNNIVSSLIKFNPLLNNQDLFSENINKIINRKIITINLSESKNLNEIFTPKILNLNRRVKKDNITINIENSSSEIQNFFNIYLKNMKRKKANQFYFFNENYFKNLKKIVDKNGYFITARLEKKMIGASIFLNFNNNSNYYLSSVSDGFKHPGVSSSIIVKGAEIGIKNKIKTINLNIYIYFSS